MPPFSPEFMAQRLERERLALEKVRELQLARRSRRGGSRSGTRSPRTSPARAILANSAMDGSVIRGGRATRGQAAYNQARIVSQATTQQPQALIALSNQLKLAMSSRRLLRGNVIPLATTCTGRNCSAMKVANLQATIKEHMHQQHVQDALKKLLQTQKKVAKDPVVNEMGRQAYEEGLRARQEEIIQKKKQGKQGPVSGHFPGGHITIGGGIAKFAWQAYHTPNVIGSIKNMSTSIKNMVMTPKSTATRHALNIAAERLPQLGEALVNTWDGFTGGSTINGIRKSKALLSEFEQIVAAAQHTIQMHETGRGIASIPNKASSMIFGNTNKQAHNQMASLVPNSGPPDGEFYMFQQQQHILELQTAEFRASIEEESEQKNKPKKTRAEILSWVNIIFNSLFALYIIAKVIKPVYRAGSAAVAKVGQKASQAWKFARSRFTRAPPKVRKPIRKTRKRK